MSNSLFKLKDTRNHVNRNGFDLSNKNAFTAKCGELLPVYWKNVLPGDSFKCKVQHFTRTQTIQTAAFTRLREEFSWFFVPNRLLWRYFPNSINSLQSQLNSTSSFNSPSLLGSKLPYINLSDIYQKSSNGILAQLRANNVKDTLGFDMCYKTQKLIGYLGYCYMSDSDIESMYNPAGGSYTQPYQQNLQVGLFPLLAYQKIYYDYFRESQWENLNPQAFNVDWMSSESQMHLTIPNYSAGSSEWYRNSIFTLRYVNWHKDMFQGILPSSQYGDVSLVEVTMPETSVTVKGQSFNTEVTVAGSKAVTYNEGKSETPVVLEGVTIQAPAGSKPSAGMPLSVSGKTSDSTTSISSLKSSFDILTLRKAQALQKLKEITQAHDLTIKGQMYAHWNVDVPDVLSQECIYLGSCSNNIDINEVVNQNLYGSDNNGEATIAGKGSGSGDDFCCSFEAKEHGIIMCLYNCVPLLEYENIGTDPQLTKVDVSDYPIPEFDRLGLDVLPSYALQNVNTVASWYGSLGYVPRYIDFKTSVDKVNGGFLETDLQSWVAPISRSYLKSVMPNYVDYRWFKVNPSVLNPIFGVQADSKLNTDQLLINSYIDVKCVRNLDFSGMPY